MPESTDPFQVARWHLHSQDVLEVGIEKTFLELGQQCFLRLRKKSGRGYLLKCTQEVKEKTAFVVKEHRFLERQRLAQ